MQGPPESIRENLKIILAASGRIARCPVLTSRAGRLVLPLLTGIVLLLSAVLGLDAWLRNQLDRPASLSPAVWTPARGPIPDDLDLSFDLAADSASLPPSQALRFAPLQGQASHLLLAMRVRGRDETESHLMSLQIGSPSVTLRVPAVPPGIETPDGMSPDIRAALKPRWVTLKADGESILFSAGGIRQSPPLPEGFKLDRLLLVSSDSYLFIDSYDIRSGPAGAMANGESPGRWSQVFGTRLTGPGATAVPLAAAFLLLGGCWLLSLALTRPVVSPEPDPAARWESGLRLSLAYGLAALACWYPPGHISVLLSIDSLLAGLLALLFCHALWLFQHRHLLATVPELTPDQQSPLPSQANSSSAMGTESYRSPWPSGILVTGLIILLIQTIRAPFGMPVVDQFLLVGLILRIALVPRLPLAPSARVWSAGLWFIKSSPFLMVACIALSTASVMTTGQTVLALAVVLFSAIELTLALVLGPSLRFPRTAILTTVLMGCLAIETGAKQMDLFILMGDAYSFGAVLYPEQFAANPMPTPWLFRDRPPSKDKGDRFRVAVLGGSVTHGSGLPTSSNEDYCSVIEEILIDQYPRLEVVNCGVPGFTSELGLELFRTQLLAYEPDVVIINYGTNDFPRDIPGPGPHRRYIRHQRWLAEHPFFLKIRLLAWRSGTYLLVRRLVVDLLGNGGVIEQRVSWTTRAEYLENLATFHQLSEQHGFRLLFSYDLDRASLGLCGSREWMRERQGLKEIFQASRDLQVPLLDARELFCQMDTESLEEHFLDEVHLTVLGHKVLGQELAKQLVRTGLLEPARRPAREEESR